MSKGQSKNGVRLTINNSSPYSTMIITDIDVEPGIDTVILDIGNSLPPYVSGEVQLKKVNKQFTDVKTLIFGGRVTSAEISNYMFPNVTHDNGIFSGFIFFWNFPRVFADVRPNRKNSTSLSSSSLFTKRCIILEAALLRYVPKSLS